LGSSRDGNIIGQAEPSGYSQEVKGGVTTELRLQISNERGRLEVVRRVHWLQIPEWAGFARRNFSPENASLIGKEQSSGLRCARP